MARDGLSHDFIGGTGPLGQVQGAQRPGTHRGRPGSDPELNPTYNAFVAVDGERALAEADAIDGTPPGSDPGPLAGIPLGVKDLQGAPGYVTTYGSALHADDPPTTADDPFIARMRAAGCVIVGKTNTPEFGWMGNTSNAIFGPLLNPFDTSRGPGGSRRQLGGAGSRGWCRSPRDPTVVAPSGSRAPAAACRA